MMSRQSEVRETMGQRQGDGQAAEEYGCPNCARLESELRKIRQESNSGSSSRVDEITGIELREGTLSSDEAVAIRRVYDRLFKIEQERLDSLRNLVLSRLQPHGRTDIIEFLPRIQL